MSKDSAQRRTLELEIKLAESEKVKNGLLEEIKWYRDQIRTSKEAGCKEVKAQFGPGAVTSDEIVASLNAAVDKANAAAAAKAQKKAEKELAAAHCLAHPRHLRAQGGIDMNLASIARTIC